MDNTVYLFFTPFLLYASYISFYIGKYISVTFFMVYSIPLHGYSKIYLANPLL